MCVPTATDLAVGDVLHPFATISKAAAVARPGDTVIVHDGVYREQVDPAHRGISDLERITYRAADGEHPVIKGSERIDTWGARPRRRMARHPAEHVLRRLQPVSRADLRRLAEHPGTTASTSRSIWATSISTAGRSTKSPTPRSLTTRRCAPTVVDNALQVVRPVDDPDQTRYVWYCEVDEHAGETTIWANFHGADPNVELVEINVRRSCFFPSRTHIDYISVIGFEMAQAACPWAPPTAPQIGMVGPNWARGWVIADNHLHDAKCSAVLPRQGGIHAATTSGTAPTARPAISTSSKPCSKDCASAGPKAWSADTAWSAIRSMTAGRTPSSVIWAARSARSVANHCYPHRTQA